MERTFATERAAHARAVAEAAGRQIGRPVAASAEAIEYARLLKAQGLSLRAPNRDDRACLNGIVFVLVTGIGWERLPQQLGYGSGMTCWRRLRDWQAAGAWDRLHALLLAELRAAGRLELARAIADSAHLRALKGGRQAVQARSTAAGPGPSITS